MISDTHLYIKRCTHKPNNKSFVLLVSWNIMPCRLEWIKSVCVCVCVSLIVLLDSVQCSLKKMRLTADCTQANTFKAELALTGNTSSPRCQSFLLGLGICPWFWWQHYYFLCWVSFGVLKYIASWQRMKSSTFNWSKSQLSQTTSFHGA